MPNFSGLWTSNQQMQAVAAGTWQAPPPFAGGTQANVVALQLQRSSVSTLSTSSFLYAYIGYNTGAGTANLFAVVGTISGTTITYGTPVLIRSDLSPQGVHCCALTSTSALITYGDTSSQWSGRAISISGTTITAGAETSISGVYTSAVMCVALTSTTALAINNTGNAARVATISGTSITWGSPTTIGSSGNYPHLSSASSTTAIFAHMPYTGDNAGKLVATALTISGTTVTAGTATIVDTTQSGDPIACVAVTATSAIVAYPAVSTSYLKAAVLTTSGTTITVGTPVTLTSVGVAFSNYDSGPMGAAISSIQALFTTTNQQSPYGLDGQILTISGTTITSSDRQIILGTSARTPTVTYLGSNKLVVGYGDSTTNISAKVLSL